MKNNAVDKRVLFKTYYAHELLYRARVHDFIFFIFFLFVFIFYFLISLYRVNTFSKALFFNVALFVHTHGSKI